MPELPDLQVFSRNLTRHVVDKKVKEITVPNNKKLNVPVKTLKKALEGQVLTRIYRDGKELFFEFSKGDILALHLMLRGKLHLFEKANTQRYTIIEILFTDGTGLAMADYQGQATPALNPEPKAAVDALSPEVNYKFLKAKLERSKAAIKNILLDQHVIRGIGNAYADEILWDAGISPFSAGNKIPDDKIRVLAKSIKSVLKNAEKQILKTHPGIISGEARDFMNVHNSKRTHSPTGAPIQHKTAGARKTYFTKEQELYQ
jgi:formamidopyrimidine-DNA glycosylase